MNRVPLALDCVKTRVPLAPPSWVASGTGIPADPDRSKASGHTQRSTPPEPRRPTPSRWPAGSLADAGRDRVLNRTVLFRRQGLNGHVNRFSYLSFAPTTTDFV